MPKKTPYPDWVMYIAYTMIFAGVLPMPVVYLLRRFQILTVDLDIHQGSIRRNETTASTKQMMDDDDVSTVWHGKDLHLFNVSFIIYLSSCENWHIWLFQILFISKMNFV